jgi:hypothetical protein
MPYRDERTSARIEAEPVSRVAEWLEATLGVRLAAFATGVSAHDLDLIAHGERDCDGEIERRLRNLYAVTWYLAAGDGAGFAHDWLMTRNPMLQGRTPADLLREGEAPEAVWFAAAPAF